MLLKLIHTFENKVFMDISGVKNDKLNKPNRAFQYTAI